MSRDRQTIRAVHRIARGVAKQTAMDNRGYDTGVITADNGDGTYKLQVMGRTDSDGEPVTYDEASPAGGDAQYAVGDPVLLPRIQGSAERISIVGRSAWKGEAGEPDVVEV